MKDEFIEEFLFVPEGPDYGDEIDALHNEVAALRAEVLELRDTIADITADTKAKLEHDSQQQELNRKQSNVESKRRTAVGVLSALLAFVGGMSWIRR